MKKVQVIILSLIVLAVVGCGGLGGQGISINLNAEHGSTISDTDIKIFVDDGGTDLGGLWYKAKDPTVNPTTQPAE